MAGGFFVCLLRDPRKPLLLVLEAPLLVLLLGVVGLSAWLAWLDYVLLPALVLFLGLAAWALIRRHMRREAK